MHEHSLKHLDPRAPLVLDTRDLPRRPGAMRVIQRTVHAPSDLGLDLIRVPEGADLTLDLRLESVTEGVLLSGTVSGPVEGECGRCLRPVKGFLSPLRIPMVRIALALLRRRVLQLGERREVRSRLEEFGRRSRCQR